MSSTVLVLTLLPSVHVLTMMTLNQVPSILFLAMVLWTSVTVQFVESAPEENANVSEIRSAINRRFAFMEKELDALDKDCSSYTSKMVMFCYHQLQDESEQFSHVSCCSYARFEDCINMKEQDDDFETEVEGSSPRQRLCSGRITDVRKSLLKLAGGDVCYGHEYPSPSCLLFFYHSIILYTLASICTFFILRCCWKACCVSHRVPPKPTFVYYRKTDPEPV